jgi:hypothetical protein
MKKIHKKSKVLGFCAMSLTTLSLATLWLAMPLPSIAATYKSIPLDTGGWLSGYAIHSSGRLYAFGDVFGTWRSDDAGNSWTDMQRDFTIGDGTVTGIAVSKGSADIVAFRTPSRLWVSNDGGNSWKAVISDLTNSPGELIRQSKPIFFHPSDDKEMWLTGERTEKTGHLWRSLDGGSTWNKIGGTFFDKVYLDGVYIRHEFPNQIWANGKDGLFVSVDRGANWTKVWSKSRVRGVVRRSDGIGYMAADGGGYRITASDWTKPETIQFKKTVGWWDGWGPTTAVVLVDGSFIGGGDGDRASDNPDNLQDAQRISTDGGLTWTYMPLDMALDSPVPAWSRPIKAGDKADGGREGIVQDPTMPSRLFMTGGKTGVVSTDGGKTWKYFPVSSGIAGDPATKVNFARRNPNIALIPVADQGVFVVTDGGASGRVSGASLPTQNTMMTTHEIMSSDDGKTLVAAGTDQGANATRIIRSFDSGKTWQALDLTNSGLPLNYDGITRSVAAPGNINDFVVVLAARGGSTPNNPGVWRTTNGGQSFTEAKGIADDIDPGMRYHQENSFLETDGVNTNTRYFATRPGGQFYRSNDGGSNWTLLPGPFGTDWIWGMAVDRSAAGKIWACAGWRGVKYSNDGGTSWNDLPGFKEAKSIDAAHGRMAVWGQREGDAWNKIYYSPDNGATWIEATGLNHRYAHTREVAVDPWVAGKVWVSGTSVNVISDITGGK